jgi:integrase
MALIPNKKTGKIGVKVMVPGHRGKQVWVGTFDTETVARREERRMKVRLDEAKEAGTLHELVPGIAPPGPPKVTCAGFALSFTENYCSELKDSTRRAYDWPLRVFARDFGDTPLADIDRLKARAWAKDQSRNTRHVIRNMFTRAMRDGIVTENPFTNMGFKESRGRKDIRVWKEEELHRVADLALTVHGPEHGPMVRAMILFSAYVGLRPGELFALKWEDIQPEYTVQGKPMPSVWIHRNVAIDGSVTTPKNGKARRVVLPPAAWDAMKDLPRRDHVFTTATGRRLSRSSLAYIWNPVRAAAGYRGMDYYELRHFCATFLLEKGLLHRQVARQLGHTDGGKLVMSTYGHPDESDELQAVLSAFAA